MALFLPFVLIGFILSLTPSLLHLYSFVVIPYILLKLAIAYSVNYWYAEKLNADGWEVDWDSTLNLIRENKIDLVISKVSKTALQ